MGHDAVCELELLVFDVAEHHGGVVAGGESQHLLKVARAGREQAAVGADDLNTGDNYLEYSLIWIIWHVFLEMRW